MWWPKLAPQLEAINASVPFQPPERRSIDEKVDELLGLMRSLQRDFLGESVASTQRKMIYRWVSQMADPNLFDELEIFHTMLDIERDVDGAPFTYGEAGLQKLAATYVARARRRLEERLEDERRNERMTQAYDDAGRPGEGEYDRDDYQEEASDEARAAEADLP